MHSPKPYSLHVYHGEITSRDSSFIDKWSKQVSNYRAVSQLDTVKYTRELPDGGFVIIYQTGDLFRAIAFKSKSEKEVRTETNIATSSIPMLFSGCIDKSVVYKGSGVEMKPSKMTLKRLANYDGELSFGELQKFRCPYTNLYKQYFVPGEIQAMGEENVMFTQYQGLKATWYSGAMAEVVQIVSGFGRQDIDNLPDDDVEQASMKLPLSVEKKVMAEMGENVRLPGYSGVPNEKGTIDYSFLFNNTNLVTFDNKNEPWLIRVDSSGVWAMPLPIIPATKTQAFREYIELVGDTEIEKILDRFGAIPSGEPFPINADFQRWVRAGVIVKVCDSSDFFNHSAYSSVCGWSCNKDGTNLINTCYDYINDYCYGYTYQISLQLGSADNRGWMAQQNTADLSPQESIRLSRYLSQLFSALPEESESLTQSIRYKIRRVPFNELLQRAGNDGANDVEYWDNYTCKPIATHEGRCSTTNQGYLYGGTTLKLPEPLLGGCISMSFAPQGPITSYPKIDTIVFAYYINNDLKVIKNFHDERKFYKTIEGNFDDVMIVGNWEQVEYSGLTGLKGTFYSTDFDRRQEIAPLEIKTKIYGEDKGYGQPLAAYHFYFWTDGRLRRSRYYTHKTQEWESSNKQIVEAFVVPFYMRSAAIFAFKEVTSSSEYNESLRMMWVEDPHSYEFWTYEPTFHSFDGGCKKTGKPEPTDGKLVWAEEHYYSNTGPYSDFADSGDWIGPLPQDVSHLVNPPTGGVTLDRYGGEPPTVETYSFRERISTPATKYELHVSINEMANKLHTREHASEFYTMSPDQFGNVFFQDGCKVIFGSVNYANISVKDEHGRRYKFGYSRLASNEQSHTFIGVINE